MRLERIILALAALMLVAGYVAWAIGGVEHLRNISLWFWFGGFGVLSLPLLASLVHRILQRIRD